MEHFTNRKFNLLGPSIKPCVSGLFFKGWAHLQILWTVLKRCINYFQIDISDQMWTGVLQSFLISSKKFFVLVFFMLPSNFCPQHSQAFSPIKLASRCCKLTTNPLLSAALSERTKNKSFFQMLCQKKQTWRCLIRLWLTSKFETFLKIFFHPNVVTYSDFNTNVVTR